MEVIIILLVLVLIFWSFSSGIRMMDSAVTDARMRRKPKEPCPYCGSMEHFKTYHVPKE